MRLVAVGDNVVDWYIEQDAMFPGGNAFNVAVLARRLGLPTAYVGKLGDDRAGQGMQATLTREGVEAVRTRVEVGPNWVCRVVLRNGDRKFLGSDRGVYTPLEIDEADFAYIGGFDLLHTSIHSEIEPFLGRLAATGVRIAFDYSDRYDDAYLERTAPHVAIAFLSLAEHDREAARGLLARVRALGPETVVVTLGAAGSVAAEGDSVHTQPAAPVEVVDTMGAGDAFIAGFLVASCDGLPLAERMAFAAKVAAANCVVAGSLGYELPA